MAAGASGDPQRVGPVPSLLAEQDEVVGLAQGRPARGAAALGVGGGDAVVVRPVAGHEFRCQRSLRTDDYDQLVIIVIMISAAL